ncbi:toast rack family protein [Leptolinea tardivitalis]|uniref:DUF2154 domain-containing protein n=1 Tax=Leptolinea tardivitalis TaxID=229920 RepID=A0A0P6X9K5_9CHLR|nr:toast rack family protein [Leptolinea tardivitalis]KPL71851.1 hypothetical protein ADM99_10560 [Leptolinea tardivitalis]GAP20245.1 hypothetical protein LTAR_00433 [Leptolinea tardivitalis]
MKKKILIILSILLMTSMACNFSVQWPKVKTGPEVVTKISEAYPSTTDTPRLAIKMGAGKLNINEGSEKFVEGEIRTNVSIWKPEISRSDDEVTISQGDKTDSVTIPSGDLINNWDLKVGKQKPINLDINAGAYTSNITFGDIQVQELTIDDGASQSKVVFNQPNKTTLEDFRYHTGASQVSLLNLGNANFKNLFFESGAGSYTLDFNGDMKQDARVEIKSGLSNMKIIIPSDRAATITLSGGVSNVSLKGTWTVDSNKYRTQKSSGPELKIEIDMGVGNLELISENGNSL